MPPPHKGLAPGKPAEVAKSCCCCTSCSCCPFIIARCASTNACCSCFCCTIFSCCSSWAYGTIASSPGRAADDGTEGRGSITTGSFASPLFCLFDSDSFRAFCFEAFLSSSAFLAAFFISAACLARAVPAAFFAASSAFFVDRNLFRRPLGLARRLDVSPCLSCVVSSAEPRLAL